MVEVDVTLMHPLATDRPNFTTLLREMRAALGSGKIISVGTSFLHFASPMHGVQLFFPALPAGYWFLRGFEPDKVDDYVDYINVMSTSHLTHYPGP